MIEELLWLLILRSLMENHRERYRTIAGFSQIC